MPALPVNVLALDQEVYSIDSVFFYRDCVESFINDDNNNEVNIYGVVVITKPLWELTQLQFVWS